MAVPSNYQKREEEDVNDLMSSIMQGRAPLPLLTQDPPQKPKPGPKPNKSATALGMPQQASLPYSTPNSMPGYNELDRPRAKSKHGKGWLVFFIFFIIIVGAGLVLFFREPLLSVLPEPKLFSEEIKNKTGYPLYYPTDLPEEFKINTSSVQESEGGRLGYVITDDNGRSISVTLQQAISGENPVDGFDKTDEPVSLSTSTGPATIFTTKQGLKAGIITGERTWIFVNMTPATASQEDFEALLKSFREG